MTFKSNICLLLFLLFASVPLSAQLSYEKGGVTYELSETKSTYAVTCNLHKDVSGSREYSLAVSRTRLTAKNLLGAGILFRDFAKANKLDNSYFQIFVDCANLKYMAELSGMVQQNTESTREIIYECPKELYKLHEASYNMIADMKDLGRIYYAMRKDGYSASKHYTHSEGLLSSTLPIARDYLSGDAQVAKVYKDLQSYNDRFFESAYSESSPALEALVSSAASGIESENPFRIFSLVELVTSSMLKDKSEFYRQFNENLSSHCLFEKFLLFCSKECSKPLPEESALMTDIILAYPGAISPFALNKGLESDYTLAAELYSQLKFDEAASLLEESINLNGVTDKNLCLLGASLRLAGKPAQALPYLILCAYLNPNTEFLLGNIAICLSELKFKDLPALILDFKNMNPDNWSSGQLDALK